MYDDGFPGEIFAAELGPDESEEQAHEENDDWLGGVGSSGGKSDGGGEDECAAIAKIFDNV